jgi:hypothetical protein
MVHLNLGVQNMKRKSKFHLLAIDPGKLTGMSLHYFNEGQVNCLWTREVDEFETAFVIEEMAKLYAPDFEIIDEKFFITEKTYKLPEAPWSLEFNGVSKYVARKYNIKYNWQSPSEAKQFCPDERLHSLGLWHKDEKGNNGDGHANDSLRHAVTYLVKAYRWRPPGLLIDDEEDEG